jgi:hypothetical protein
MQAVGHARLSPSAASRWVKCPGSVPLAARYPEIGCSAAAEEGTASHWIGSETLSGKGRTMQAWVGVKAPNGIVIDMEMVDGAYVYVEAVKQAAGVSQALTVEQPVACSPVHADCWGTPDLWYWCGSPGTAHSELHVWDYKYGYGIVEPFENWQLICYAAGLLASLTGAQDQQVTVVLHIVQPRPFHSDGPVREWRVSGSDLRGYINRLSLAAHQAVSATPCTATGHHCRYCAGRHACPTLDLAIYAGIDYIGQAQPEELSVGAMAMEYKVLERIEVLIKSRKSAHESRMIGMIKAGESVPGYTIDYGSGHAKWNKPVGEIISLGQMMGLELVGEPTAITPAKALKLGLDPVLVKAYSERPVTGTKLVATAGSLANRVFGVSV